ncbi:PAAR-like protein [Cysteiniphilum sp. 6C5]|uniref:PAAR-like protein n=1 Tax=unclassified Cysteiniphilum TaxID=2610889 RepID=UPI003F873D44
MESELVSSEQSMCPNAQTCQGNCHNQQVKALANAWQYALIGAYAATDYQSPTQDALASDSDTSFKKNATDYDNMLKASMSNQTSTYQSNIDQLANVDALKQGASDQQAQLYAFKDNANLSEPALPDLSSAGSPAQIQMMMASSNLNALNNYKGAIENCPDDMLAEQLNAQNNMGLNQEALVQQYNSALQQSIAGHAQASRFPQANQFMLLQQSYTSAVSSLMPFARSHSALNANIGDFQQRMNDTSNALMQLYAMHNSAQSSQADINAQMTKVQMAIANTQASFSQLNATCQNNNLYQQSLQTEAGIYRAHIEATQVNYQLSQVKQESSSATTIANDDDLQQRISYISTQTQHISRQYWAAQSADAATQYQPLATLNNQLQQHQLSEDSVNQQMIKALNNAQSAADIINGAKGCKDFANRSGKYAQALDHLNTSLTQLNIHAATISNGYQQKLNDQLIETNEHMNGLHNAHAHQIASLSSCINNNKSLSQAQDHYAQSLGQFNQLQSQMKSQAITALNGSPQNGEKRLAQIQELQDKAMSAYAKAQADYAKLKAAYLEKLADIQAAAQKMQSILNSKLNAANAMTQNLSNQVSQTFCNVNPMASLSQSAPINEIATLQPSTFKKLNQLNTELIKAQQNMSGLTSQSRSAQLTQNLAVISQSQAQVAEVLNDMQQQVNKQIATTKPKLCPLLSTGVDVMQSKADNIKQSLIQARMNFPSCPHATDQINDAYQQVNQLNLTFQQALNPSQDQVALPQNLLQLRDNALSMQANSNNLLANGQTAVNTSITLDQPIALNTQSMATFPAMPNEQSLLASMQLPPLPDINSLLPNNVVIPQLTDMLNQLTAALGCVMSAFAIPSGSGEKMVAVSSGAEIRCMMGAAPLPLTVLPFGVNLSPGKPATLPINMIPFLNVKPFSPCTNPANPLVIASLGAPSACMPLTLPWFPLATMTQGLSMPLVRQNSQLHCAFTAMSGMVTVVNPGQDAIEVA